MSPDSPPSTSALCRPLRAIEDGGHESEGAGGRRAGERRWRWRARWREAAVAGARPQERWGHSAVAWDGKLIVFGVSGGTRASGGEKPCCSGSGEFAVAACVAAAACVEGCFGAQHFSTVLSLDLTTLAWAPLSAHGHLPPPCDCHSASLLSRGRMLVFGGTDGRRRLAATHLLHLPSKRWQRVGGGAAGERSARCVLGGSVSEVGGAIEEGGVERSEVREGGERGQQGAGEVESGVSCVDEAGVTARQGGRGAEGRRRQVERRGSDGSHVSSSSVVVRHGGEGEGGEGLVWGTRQGSGGDTDMHGSSLGTPCGRVGPVQPGSWHDPSALAAAHPPARESHAAAVVWLPRCKRVEEEGGGDAVEWRETVLVFGGSGDEEGGDGADGKEGMDGWRGGEQRDGGGEGGSMSEGGGKGRYLNDLWALDVPSMTWRCLHAPHSLPPATRVPRGKAGECPPCARDSHSMVVMGGAHEQQVAVVFGGDCGARYLGDLHLLHVHHLSWCHVRTHWATGVRGCAVRGCAVGWGGVLWGGGVCCERLPVEHISGGVGVVYVGIPAPAGAQWPAPRAAHSAVAVTAWQMLLLGGVGDGGYFSDTWLFDLPSATWHQLHPPITAGPAMLASDNSMVEHLEAEEASAAAAEAWAAGEEDGQQLRACFSHSATLLPDGCTVALFGGCGRDEQPCSDVMLLHLQCPAASPSPRCARPLSSASLPAPAAARTGREEEKGNGAGAVEQGDRAVGVEEQGGMAEGRWREGGEAMEWRAVWEGGGEEEAEVGRQRIGEDRSFLDELAGILNDDAPCTSHPAATIRGTSLLHLIPASISRGGQSIDQAAQARGAAAERGQQGRARGRPRRYVVSEAGERMVSAALQARHAGGGGEVDGGEAKRTGSTVVDSPGTDGDGGEEEGAAEADMGREGAGTIGGATLSGGSRPKLQPKRAASGGMARGSEVRGMSAAAGRGAVELSPFHHDMAHGTLPAACPSAAAHEGHVSLPAWQQPCGMTWQQGNVLGAADAAAVIPATLPLSMLPALQATPSSAPQQPRVSEAAPPRQHLAVPSSLAARPLIALHARPVGHAQSHSAAKHPRGGEGARGDGRGEACKGGGEGGGGGGEAMEAGMGGGGGGVQGGEGGTAHAHLLHLGIGRVVRCPVSLCLPSSACPIVHLHHPMADSAPPPSHSLLCCPPVLTAFHHCHLPCPLLCCAGQPGASLAVRVDGVFDGGVTLAAQVGAHTLSGVLLAPPAVSPTAPPAVSPTAPPAVSPTAPPAVSPTAPPAVSPTAPPAVSPTAPPAVSPTAPPAVSPTAPPAVSPTAPPAVSPTAPPAVSPTALSGLACQPWPPVQAAHRHHHAPPHHTACMYPPHEVHRHPI
ncbi:unnamed protein product [Closterium sp. NIES-65]|nr:unnamed protein product [Closterium sp. NIES-65]